MSEEIRLRARYVSVVHSTGRGVAERWRSQYERGGWCSTASGSSKDTYERLCALGENPDVDAVAQAIGNKSWSYLTCDGCNEYVRVAIRIGEAAYEEPKKYCATCVREAAAVIGEVA